MTRSKGRVLLIEDDPVMGGALAQRLKLENFEVQWERTASDGLATLRASKPDAVVSDIRLPDRSGEHLYMDALSLLGRTPIIFVTAFTDLPQAIRLVQAGADDYLQKPFSTDKLISRLHYLISRTRRHYAHDITVDPFELSATLASLSNTLKKLANLDASVLVCGETGVGKELVSRYIYEQSNRRGAPFVAVNCAAIPAENFERTMFGQEGMSTTREVASHIGYLEEAADGVLLLDEVSEIHPQLQAALLRVLEERRFRRTGGTTDIEFRARIVATTNTDLRERVAIGKFRDDLFYRLAMAEIIIPPLRDRVGEIKPLSTHFLQEASTRAGRPGVEFSQEASDAMHRYSWPGNVRELRNRIERAMALAESNVITELDLFPDHTFLERHREGALATARSIAERKEIEIALAQSDGKIGDAAKALGISRTTLWKRMKSLSLSEGDADKT